MIGETVLDRQAFPILVIAGPDRQHAAGETLKRITSELETLGHRVITTTTAADAAALVTSDPSFGCVLLDWNIERRDQTRPAEEILASTLRRHPRIPVFLIVERHELAEMDLPVTESVQEYILLFEDTPTFVAGRVDYAWRRRIDRLLPPFFAQLSRFTDSHEYSWHTPGHSGGTAFRKTQVGKAFYEFYGETLFRTDLSVSVGELGSLLDHSGAVGEAEKNASRVFGSEATYFVLNGTSTANQIVAHNSIIAGDVVLADRNCHKSINYGLTVTDAIPVYLVPSRNGYGIIGPIPPAQLMPAAIAAAITAHPQAAAAVDTAPVYSVITNSTYDGLCYNAEQVVALLGPSVPRIHFDEAWFAYARFHPLYAGRFGMHEGRTPEGPTIFATQSTHKLLAAFSQGSMIHIKAGDRAPVERTRFNEAYMMHGSTSPFYPMIASLDVATAMMDGPGGTALIAESILEAIEFRQQIVRTGRKLADSDRGWFFGVWQPDDVRDPVSGQRTSFADAPIDLLAGEPSCWNLEAGLSWHGFKGLETGYCLLDPIKVTLTTPGVDAAGAISTTGIPAAVVASYLDGRRIEMEKTGDYTLLILFSIGTTNGKWGTLLESLLSFKRDYDSGVLVRDAIPDLASAHPDRYGALTVRQLCDQMHEEMTGGRVIQLLDEAFEHLPEPETTPGEAYRRLVRGKTEPVMLADLAGRTAAVMVVPYPPGIPILMPGENTGAEGGALLGYLHALQAFDIRYPGFTHDIHGVQRTAAGLFMVECLTPPPAGPH